jgi:hypothetical protein
MEIIHKFYVIKHVYLWRILYRLYKMNKYYLDVTLVVSFDVRNLIQNNY